MKIKKSVTILLLFFTLTYMAKNKIITLIADKNKEILITECLKGTPIYADTIVFLDNTSNEYSI